MNALMRIQARQRKSHPRSKVRALRSLRLLAILVAVACLQHFMAAEAEASGERVAVIQTAKGILALSTDEAERAHPAVVRGVVTGATEYGLFVQDYTAGIWVQQANQDRLYSSGDFIEIAGKTGGGLFSPDLVADRVTRLGRAPLPVPKEAQLKALLAGDENDQFVAVTGIVRSVDLRSNVSRSQQVWIELLVEREHIFATLPGEDALAAQRLLGAQIRIQAAAACTKNFDRQITSVVLSIAGIDNVKVLKPPPLDLFNAPSLRVSQLLQYRAPVAPDGRVRVEGIVTYVRSGESLIVQDGAKAALVRSTQRDPIKPGDEVEVVGYPTAAPSGPFLDASVYRFIRAAAVPAAHLATVEELSSGRLNYNLISITGKLLHHASYPLRQELLVQEGAASVIAELNGPVKNSSLEWLRDGSTVRITGISVLTVEGSWNQGGPAASVLQYSVMLRSPADIVELKPPSWWSTTHLFYLAVVFAVLMLIFFALALYGRLQRWRLETINEERERVAYEVHDTLAQSFAGIGFQLQAIRKAIPTDYPELTRQVDLARALVRHSHKEARQSIDPRDLRTLADVDVLEALDESANKLVEGGHVSIRSRHEGTAQALPGLIKDVLLHVGQEAVANAVRHADPREILITLEFVPGAVRLTVSDDGNGFVERGDVLGFGLRSMRKRAASIGASLSIVTEIGQGTSVTMLCSLPRRVIAKLYYSWVYGA